MTQTVKQITLGTEEIALALALVGRPDLGRDILHEIHENLTDEHTQALLTSASHSLLAHDLAEIVNGQAKVLPELGSVLDPILKHDYLVTLSLGTATEQINALIRVQKQGSFTSHFIRSGVVHVLENGPTAILADFLLSVLERFAIAGADDQAPLPVSLALISKAMKATAKHESMAALFAESGWPEAMNKMIAEDFETSTGRASIVRADITSEMKADPNLKVKSRSVLLIRSQARAWMVEFEDFSDNATGSICPTTHEGLAAAIRRNL
jgi:hypothetical protein